MKLTIPCYCSGSFRWKNILPPIRFIKAATFLLLAASTHAAVGNGDKVTRSSKNAPLEKMAHERFISVTGKVVDANGNPLRGVTIMIKNTQIGTVTDENGNFRINVGNGNAVLVISSLGFASREIPVENKGTLHVVLQPAANSMNEVVVVGYNTQRRADLTGSVASVKAEDIADLPSSSLSNALQGRIPGAFISQTDGNPMSSAAIIIRGPLSINGGEPLIVVDGVPFQGTGYNFNNQDIESIDVLKDASAAAVYGYRAAGGVILIRTKRGKSGVLKVGFNTNIGIRNVVNLPSTLHRDEYLQAKEAFGFNVENLYGPRSEWSALPDTDWFGEVFRPGTEQNYTVHLSGGSEKSNFYLSGNYGKIEGTRVGNAVERYTFRVNSEHKLSKRLKVGQTLFTSFTREDPNNSSNQGDLSFRHTPLMSVYDATNPVGGWGRSPQGFRGSNDMYNALGNYTYNETYEALLTAYLDAQIVSGLNLRAVFGTGLTGTNNYFYNYRADLGAVVPEETFGKSLSKRQNFIATYTLTYDKFFGEHNLKVLAGYEARKSDFSDLSGNNRNPLVPIPQNFNLVESIAAATVNGSNSNVDDRVLSQFGRLEYGFMNKYLLTATVRRDGLASKFGPNNRYGIFPGVSAGWKVSEEKFMQQLEQVSSLKLRAGYGLLGNSVGTNFAYSAAYGTGFTYDYGGGRLNSVNIINRLPNPDIKWESVGTLNIGLDAGFFEERLILNLDYYNRQTKDMIYRIGIATSAGLSETVQTNIGQMSNKGFEFNLVYNDGFGKDFTYSIGLNGATNKNKLIFLDPSLGKSFLSNGELSEAHDFPPVTRSEPGRELSNFYGYRVLGIYQDDEVPGSKRPTINGGYIPVAGDLIYADINNDGEINADDQTFIGTPWPKFTYGINLKLAYKSFDLNAFFNGVSGASLYNSLQTYEHLFYSDYNSTSKIFETSGFAGNGVTSKPRID